MRRPKALTITLILCFFIPYLFNSKNEGKNNKGKTWYKYKGKPINNIIIEDEEEEEEEPENPLHLEELFLPMKNVTEFDTEQEKRRKRIEEVCEKHQNSRFFKRKVYSSFPKSAFYMFTVSLDQRLVWCRVGKTGTSSWSAIMLQLMKGSKDKGITNGNS